MSSTESELHSSSRPPLADSSLSLFNSSHHTIASIAANAAATAAAAAAAVASSSPCPAPTTNAQEVQLWPPSPISIFSSSSDLSPPLSSGAPCLDMSQYPTLTMGSGIDIETASTDPRPLAPGALPYPYPYSTFDMSSYYASQQALSVDPSSSSSPIHPAHHLSGATSTLGLAGVAPSPNTLSQGGIFGWSNQPYAGYTKPRYASGTAIPQLGNSATYSLDHQHQQQQMPMSWYGPATPAQPASALMSYSQSYADASSPASNDPLKHPPNLLKVPDHNRPAHLHARAHTTPNMSYSTGMKPHGGPSVLAMHAHAHTHTAPAIPHGFEGYESRRPMTQHGHGDKRVKDGKKRTRVAEACVGCRKRKCKCVGGNPCNRCRHKGIACTFDRTDKRGDRSPLSPTIPLKKPRTTSSSLSVSPAIPRPGTLSVSPNPATTIAPGSGSSLGLHLELSPGSTSHEMDEDQPEDEDEDMSSSEADAGRNKSVQRQVSRDQAAYITPTSSTHGASRSRSNGSAPPPHLRVQSHSGHATPFDNVPLNPLSGPFSDSPAPSIPSLPSLASRNPSPAPWTSVTGVTAQTYQFTPGLGLGLPIGHQQQLQRQQQQQQQQTPLTPYSPHSSLTSQTSYGTLMTPLSGETLGTITPTTGDSVMGLGAKGLDMSWEASGQGAAYTSMTDDDQWDGAVHVAAPGAGDYGWMTAGWSD